MKFIVCLMVCCNVLLLAGCEKPEAPATSSTPVSQEDVKEMKQVTGTVNYRERIRLTPDTIVEVSLLDVSKADAKAKLIAQQTITEPGTPPIPFTLDVDPSKIDSRMSYVVRAEIKRGERLQMTTDKAYPVLTRGAADSAELWLVSVPAKPSKPDASLTNTYWKLIAIGDQPYSHANDQREPHVKFIAEDSRVTGNGGCNTFMGGFETNADSLTFTPLASTQMACINGMDIEHTYLQALQAVTGFKIKGDSLELFTDGKPVLKFEAVYF